jgi:hypothetical protein
MTQLQRVLILLMVAGIPAAAPPVPGSSPTLCLAAGSFTYRVWPNAAAADLRVKIDSRAAPPDLRIELVDSIEGADFAVVDDVGASHSGACSTSGAIKTVKAVSEREQADITISLSRDDPAADLRLYVHSTRFGHRDAAALLAAMRHYEHAGIRPALAEDAETSW